MSSTNQNEENCKENIRMKKFAIIKDVKKLTQMDIEGIIDYVKKLHRFLEKRQKKIKKYKDKLKTWEKKYKKLKKSAKEKSVESDVSDRSQKQNPKEHNDESEELEDRLKFVNELRQVADSAQNENGFVYEPTSGLYYDRKTGYYYNAEYGLYYDGNTGSYYKFNQDKNEFEFHSQIYSSQRSKKNQAQQNDDSNDITDLINGSIVNDGEQDYLLSKVNNRRSHLVKKRRLHDIDENDSCEDDQLTGNREDGEITSSESESDGYQNYELTHYQDIAKRYPPSLRIVVQETNLDKIKVGTLYIITFKGGTLGREGNHDVVIPDINISKFHLKFTYDEKKEIYQCVDLGSRNGTLLNGKRISPAKQESELTDIVHGSVLQLSQTKLMCHIHSGNTTCGLCEPGLLIETKDTGKVELLSHKQQLKKLQKRYGLENEKYTEKNLSKGEKYKDRASDRRINVGSSSQHEKTEVASVETQISSANKGFKMLSKLGWKEGEALGKERDGLLQPISVVSNEGTAGLGCKVISSSKLNKGDLRKIKQWKKAQERYENISKTDIFCESDATDSA